jgi:hypothetical protein
MIVFLNGEDQCQHQTGQETRQMPPVVRRGGHAGRNGASAEISDEEKAETCQADYRYRPEEKQAASQERAARWPRETTAH